MIKIHHSLCAALLLAACTDGSGSSKEAGAPETGVDAARLEAGSEAGADAASLDAGPDAAVAEAGADAGGPFTAAAKGAYIIGSSFAQGIKNYIETFTKESGLTVPVTEWITGGASIWTIWFSSNPTEKQTHLGELASGKYDVLFMNAQRPWRLTGSEALAGGNFAEKALTAVPDYRVLIQVYWTFEQSPYRFSETSTRDQDLAMYRQGALRVAQLMSSKIKAPVFVAPVGLAIERVKELATGGKLQAYKTRAALHQGDGSHLSDLGNYIQALVIHGAAYQDKPQGHSRKLGSGGGAKTLSTADANLVWGEVNKVLRDTPFSGWYGKAPTTLAGYQASLKAALRNWETFDNFTSSTVGSGSFVGRDGVSWSYTKSRAQAGAPRLINTTLYMEQGGTLTATLPKGLDQLHFIFSPLTSGATATVEVLAKGISLGSKTRSQDNTSTLYATVVSGINTKGALNVELRCKAGPCLVDSVQWTDYP